MTRNKYPAAFPYRWGRWLGQLGGAVLLVGVLLLGGRWLMSVVGSGGARPSESDQKQAATVVPALAQIPWHNNPCHPKAMRLYGAVVPGYSPRMAVVWWWTNVRVVRAGNATVAGLLQALCQADGRGRAQGLHQFVIWMRRNRWKAYQPIQRTLLPAVLDAGQYGTALGMTRRMILMAPENTGWVQFLLMVRTQIFLAARCPNRALDSALRLYNVCTMRDVQQAVALIAQCLQSGATGDGRAARSFVAWQIMAQYGPRMAKSQCCVPAAFLRYGGGAGVEAAAGDVGMARVWSRLKPNPYSAIASRITGEDFNSLMRRGNLLLLANRCREAALVWDRAYGVAAGAGQLQIAAESIARTTKALYKTVGRANQWVNEVESGKARRR